MERTRGDAAVVVGLVDGPIAVAAIPSFVGKFRPVAGSQNYSSDQTIDCRHGTMVAGIIAGERGLDLPAICPDCSFIASSTVSESGKNVDRPALTPDLVAQAITNCADAGARLLNLSAAFLETLTAEGEKSLQSAIDHAIHRGVILIVAAGNYPTLRGTVLTQHPWVIPVSACDVLGLPLARSNFGLSIGRNGLRAPGDRILSISPEGESIPVSGTSVSTAIVSGIVALCWSEFPRLSAGQVRYAVKKAHKNSRAVIPSLLDAVRLTEALNSVSDQI